MPVIAIAPDTIIFGIVGLGWMGQVHARAMSRVLQHFPDLELRPQLVGVADPAGDGRLNYAADVLGARFTTSDWSELVVRDDIDVIWVAVPTSHIETWPSPPRTLVAELVEAALRSNHEQRWITVSDVKPTTEQESRHG